MKYNVGAARNTAVAGFLSSRRLPSFQEPKKNTSWIVYIGTFPPRACGIGTFTQDLTNAFDELYVPREESRVVAMNVGDRSGYDYRKKVIAEINEQKLEDYLKAAHFLNDLREVRLVNIQHEYGIFGGEYGSHIIHFMKAVERPIVLTMHSVLPNPNPELHTVTQDLTKYADRIVVMTKLAKNFLIRDYGVPESKISVIPHGIHPLPYTEPAKMKEEFDLVGKKVLSTFGLLSRGKGIEYVLKALPQVVAKYPDVVYLVIGATHPSVLKKEGEAYRQSLINKTRALGLEKHVVFINKYVELPELLKYIQATDIYLAVPLDPNQAVSGTLSYALGAGRTVIATKFAQALEVVTPDIGRLVNFKNSDEIKSTLFELLANDSLRESMGQIAYFKTRKMEWRNVIISYMKEYISLVPQLGKKEKNLPKIKLRHLIKMTDDFGLFQFARHIEPDPEWGYTVDDNARALMAMISYYEKNGGDIALKLIKTYLNFIEYVSDPDKKWFRNYVNYDRTFHHERNTTENLSDANSRTMYALVSTAASSALPFDVRHKAASLFTSHLDLHRKITTPRTLAQYIKAFDMWLTVEQNPEIEKTMKKYVDNLVRLYKKNATADWSWFEEVMTYSNGVLPEVLFIAYRRFRNPEYLALAQASLNFLLTHSFQDDICVPVGQGGWFRKGQKKNLYDQQPEEVTALVLALKQAWEITREEHYKNKMLQAFQWFLGNNLLDQVIYDYETGGSYDGLGEKTVNLNQGAESSVVYLLARLAFE